MILEAEGTGQGQGQSQGQGQGQNTSGDQYDMNQEGPRRIRKASHKKGSFPSEYPAGLPSNDNATSSQSSKVTSQLQCTSCGSDPTQLTTRCSVTSYSDVDNDVTYDSADVRAWCGECAARGQQEGDALGRLKQYAAKLNLPTRRPSYLTWRQEHFDDTDTPLVTVQSPTDVDVTWSEERCRNIDVMLKSIREDLVRGGGWGGG